MSTKLALLLALGCLASSVAGCGGKRPRSAAEYFREGNSNFRGGALGAAVENYRELLDQHPFSEHSEEVELKIAQAQYLDGKFAEAVVALTDFQRRHPTSPHLPFVGYTLGMCYVRQLGSIDRDQTAAQNAQTYMLTVSRQYPESPFAELAREQLARCRENLAANEAYVADFYRKRGNTKAAEVRLLTGAAKYPETPSAARGLIQLAETYDRQGRTKDAILAYRAITRSQPGTSDAIAAQEALQRLNAEDGDLTSDPLETLLAGLGRQRTTSGAETVQVPGVDMPSIPRRPAGMPGPGLGPSFDPFGRGRSYY